MPPRHIALPRHSHQLAGGEGGELQGEGGVVVVSIIEPLTGCHKLWQGGLQGQTEFVKPNMPVRLAQARLTFNFKRPTLIAWPPFCCAKHRIELIFDFLTKNINPDICFAKFLTMLEKSVCEAELQVVTPWSVSTGWQRGVLSILQPTIRVSQVVTDQPLAFFTIQKMFPLSLGVSLSIVRPPLIFSCLHKLPKTISHFLCCPSS